MPEAVFPNPVVEGGVLPFHRPASITMRDGTPVTNCQVGAFRASARSSAVGQAIDYMGFASEEAAVAEYKQNLILTVDGIEYRIINATHHRFARYVELDLRRVLANG